MQKSAREVSDGPEFRPERDYLSNKFMLSSTPTIPLVYKSHWEESLQSVSDFIFSKHCGCTPRGVRGVKRPEIL